MSEKSSRWAKREAALHGLPKKNESFCTVPCRTQENCDDCGVLTFRHMELMSKG